MAQRRRVHGRQRNGRLLLPTTESHQSAQLFFTPSTCNPPLAHTATTTLPIRAAVIEALPATPSALAEPLDWMTQRSRLGDAMTVQADHPPATLISHWLPSSTTVLFAYCFLHRDIHIMRAARRQPDLQLRSCC